MPVACSFSGFTTVDHYGPAKLIVLHGSALLAWLATETRARGTRRLSFLGDLSPLALAAALAWMLWALLASSLELGGPRPSPHLALLDGLAFLVWAGVIARAARERPAKLLGALRFWSRAGLIAVLGYGALQLAGIEPFPWLHRAHEFPVSFFGFQNITAEYLVLALTLLAAELVDRRRPGLLALMLATLAAIALLKSRAAWVALPLALVAPVALAGLARGRQLKGLLIAAAGGLAIITIGLAAQVLAPRDSWDSLKSANTGLRLARWSNTLELIGDRPLGTGAGSFAFEYLPYATRAGSGDWEASETLLIQTPHNSFLGLAAEGGLPVALLIAALAALLLLGLWRARPAPELQPLRVSALSLALVLGVCALFAFPWSGGYGFLCLSLVAGLASACLPRGRLALRPLAIVVVIGLAWLGFAHARARLSLTHQSFKVAPFRAACQGFPSDWRACLRYADRAMFARELGEAEEALRAMLKASPHNFFALRRLADLRVERGDNAEACELYQRYNALFQRNSSVRDRVRQVCPI